MSKFKEKETEEEAGVPEITNRDIEDLRRELKRFPQMKLNGVLISPFDQYLCSLGTMKYGNHGVVVHDAAGYTRMSKINKKLELRQYYEDQEFFEQNPEAKAAYHEKFGKMRAKTERNRMNYELAKGLKEAGWPQKFTPSIGNPDAAPTYPTLEELIEACGEEPPTLTPVSDVETKWEASRDGVGIAFGRDIAEAAGIYWLVYKKTKARKG